MSDATFRKRVYLQNRVGGSQPSSKLIRSFVKPLQPSLLQQLFPLGCLTLHNPSGNELYGWGKKNLTPLLSFSRLNRCLEQPEKGEREIGERQQHLRREKNEQEHKTHREGDIKIIRHKESKRKSISAKKRCHTATCGRKLRASERCSIFQCSITLGRIYTTIQHQRPLIKVLNAIWQQKSDIQ